MTRALLTIALFAGFAEVPSSAQDSAGGDPNSDEGGLGNPLGTTDGFMDPNTGRISGTTDPLAPMAAMMGEGGMPKAKSSVRILRLDKLDAAEVAKVLKDIVGPGERISAYPRTNSLVIHATDEQHDKIAKLLGQLGELASRNPQRSDSGDMLDDAGGAMGGYSGERKTSTASALDAAKLKNLYANSENQSFEAAQKLREAMKQPAGDRKQIEILEKRLKESVTESFQYRQDQHRAEIAQLEAKIRKMKSLLDSREKIKGEIIDRRVQDLKNPNRRWEREQNTLGAGGASNPFARNASLSTVKIKGFVTAVGDNDKLVEISVGIHDRIKTGETFTVIREGLHVGKGEVIEVTENWAALGRLIEEDSELAPVKVGDRIEMQPARSGGPGVLPMGPIGLPGPAVLPGGATSPTHSVDLEAGGGVSLTPRSAPSKQGTIISMHEELQLVEISLGTDDGLKRNTRLHVWAGAEPMGEVEVTTVGKDRSMARIIKSNQVLPIRKGYLENILKTWKERASEVKCIEGKLNGFVYDNVFNVEKRSIGDFYYEAPNKVAVHLEPKRIASGEVSQKKNKTGKSYDLRPGLPERWIVDGKETWMWHADTKQIKRYKDAKDAIVPMPDSILVVFSHQAFEQGRYSTRLISDTQNQAWIELTRKNSGGTHWHRAMIIFDKGIQLPTAVQLIYHVGNLEIVYSFRDLKVNQPRPKWIVEQFGLESTDVFPPPGPEADASPNSGVTAPLDEKSVSPSIQLNLTGPKMANVLWTDSNKIPAYAVILPGRIKVPSDGEAVFRLENLPTHPNLELFGSFANHAETSIVKTYVEHNAVAVEFTNEDVDQAASGNLVTKVFYLPKSKASPLTSPEVLVSTRLDPGLDPLVEAKKRGDVIGVLRLGNRRAEIGEDEDWHERFLKGYLERIEAERESILEELSVLEDTLIELGEDTVPEEFLRKMAERKADLEKIDERKKVFEQKLKEHAESDRGAEAEAEAEAEKPGSR